jgi:hypothetical protein
MVRFSLGITAVPPTPSVNTSPTKTQTFSTRDLLLATKIVMAKDALKRIEEVWA